jgi:hypothetical protein
MFSGEGYDDCMFKGKSYDEYLFEEEISGSLNLVAVYYFFWREWGRGCARFTVCG